MYLSVQQIRLLSESREDGLRVPGRISAKTFNMTFVTGEEKTLERIAHTKHHRYLRRSQERSVLGFPYRSLGWHKHDALTGTTVCAERPPSLEILQNSALRWRHARRSPNGLGSIALGSSQLPVGLVSTHAHLRNQAQRPLFACKDPLLVNPPRIEVVLALSVSAKIYCA